jgi:hypothetical protein
MTKIQCDVDGRSVVNQWLGKKTLTMQGLFSIGSAPRPLLCNGSVNTFNNRGCVFRGIRANELSYGIALVAKELNFASPYGFHSPHPSPRTEACLSSHTRQPLKPVYVLPLTITRHPFNKRIQECPLYFTQHTIRVSCY